MNDRDGTTHALSVVREIYAAQAGGDIEGFVSRFARDIEWTIAAGMPDGGTYFGLEAVTVVGLFAGYAQSWEEFRVVPAEFYGSEGTVVVLGHYRGTHRATRKSVDARFAHVWHFEDGKVVRFETIDDSHVIVSAAH